MSSSGPFVDPDSNELDIAQIVSEAVPLVGLMVLFGALAAIPFLFALLVPLSSVLSVVFTLLSQFVLAVGTGIVLLYVVARGTQLAGA